MQVLVIAVISSIYLFWLFGKNLVSENAQSKGMLDTNVWKVSVALQRY